MGNGNCGPAGKQDRHHVHARCYARAGCCGQLSENPLLYYSLAVLTRDELLVNTWEDLNKPEVRISVPQATSMDKFLTENVGKANIQRLPGNQEAIAAFQAGRADAVTLFRPPLLAARQRLGSGKIIVPKPAQAQPSSAAVRKEDDKTFVNWVDEKFG